MTRGALIALTCVACAPAATTEPVFALLDEGQGDALLEALPHEDGSRWLYGVETLRRDFADDVATSEVVLQGTTVLDGVTVQREVAGSDVVWVEHRDDGMLVHGFGTTAGVGRFSSPAVLLSYPLRLGRRWTTGDDDTPERFTFAVTAEVELEVPAGRLRCARVDSLDVQEGDPTTRFYASEVGLVAREQLGEREEIRTQLLGTAFPQEVP